MIVLGVISFLCVLGLKELTRADISSTEAYTIGEFPELFDQKRGKHGPPIRYQASDGATILAMVREGLGITILPRMMFPEKLEGIAGIPLDPPLQLQIGLAVRSADSASPGAALFVQTAVAWVQEQAALLPRAR